MKTKFTSHSSKSSLNVTDKWCEQVKRVYRINSWFEICLWKGIEWLPNLCFFRFAVTYEFDDYFFMVHSFYQPYFRKVTSLLDPTIFPLGTYNSLRSVTILDTPVLSVMHWHKPKITGKTILQSFSQIQIDESSR